MILPIITLIVACLLSLVLVPVLSRFVAPRIGLLDQPDGNRKLHRTAIPLVGGIAVFLSVTLTALVIFVCGQTEIAKDYLLLKPTDPKQFFGLFLGAGFLLIVGVVDDSRGLRGRQKLIGQIISASILIAFGYNFERVVVMGVEFNFGVFSVAMVLIWVLAVVNSINLLDGADGFASTIGIILCISLAVMALNHPNGRVIDGLVMLALAGALAGFLRFNFPPAKVFLGDAGSMLIGFVIAAIAIRCTFKQATAYAFFAPIALLAIPFFDTSAAIIRRKMTGRSIYSVDRGHLHHSLAKQGYGPRISLLWVAFLCATTCVGAVIAFMYRHAEYALVSIVIVAIVMVMGRLFGVAEVELISNKAKSMGTSFLGKSRKQEKEFSESAVQLQGNRNWSEVWDELQEFSDENDLNEITFDINLPWLHESFHAKKRRHQDAREENSEWYAEVPLIVDGKIYGRVEILAERSRDHYAIISNLLKVTEDLESILKEITGMNGSNPLLASDRPEEATGQTAKLSS